MVCRAKIIGWRRPDRVLGATFNVGFCEPVVFYQNIMTEAVRSSSMIKRQQQGSYL